jgi:hypothetical protein
MLGNFFWGLSLLLYFAIILSNQNKPAGSGDSVMGYGLAMAFFGICFTISTGVLIFSIASKGGFDWAARQPLLTMLVLAGWLMSAATVFFLTILKWEPDPEIPVLVRGLMQVKADLWTPLLLLVPSFFLLNNSARASVSAGVYQYPLVALFVLSTLVCLSLLWYWIRLDMANQQAVAASEQADEIRRHQENLDYIAKQTPADPILNIITFTGRFQDEDVREAALEKFSRRSDLEGDLIALLRDSNYYHYAYTYLDANQVEHPEHFIAPVKESLHVMAEEIRNGITDNHNLQDWHFEHLGIERLLRFIDGQLPDRKNEFKPEFELVLKSFDTERAESAKNIRLLARRVLAQWMEHLK